MVSWYDDKDLLLRVDIINWNSLSKKKILSYLTTYFEKNIIYTYKYKKKKYIYIYI